MQSMTKAREKERSTETERGRKNLKRVGGGLEMTRGFDPVARPFRTETARAGTLREIRPKY